MMSEEWKGQRHVERHKISENKSKETYSLDNTWVHFWLVCRTETRQGGSRDPPHIFTGFPDTCEEDKGV